MNTALCRLVGYTREELLESNFQAITDPGDLETDLASLVTLLNGEIDLYEQERRYFHKDGTSSGSS